MLSCFGDLLEPDQVHDGQILNIQLTEINTLAVMRVTVSF
jgi:hypothetical protein